MNIPVTDVTPYKTGLNKQRDFHIHTTDGNLAIARMDRYPRKVMKKERQQTLQGINTERMTRRWSDLRVNFEPNYQLTTSAVCSTLERENHLDCANQRAHSFRINSIGRNLQFLEKLGTYHKWRRDGDRCFFCKEQETNDHIWECQYIKTNYETFVEKTKEYAIKELKTNCKKRKVEITESTEDAVNTAADIMFGRYEDDTGMWYNKEEFLSSPEARCLVTESYKTWFNDIAEILEEEGSNSELNYESDKWLVTTMVGAWNRALYELWWRPRTARFQKEQRKAVKRLEKVRKAEEKEKKSQSKRAAKATRSKALRQLKQDRAEAEDRRRKHFKTATNQEEDEPEDEEEIENQNPSQEPTNDKSRKRERCNSPEQTDRKRPRTTIPPLNTPMAQPTRKRKREGPEEKRMRPKATSQKPGINTNQEPRTAESVLGKRKINSESAQKTTENYKSKRKKTAEHPPD
jgi:hypothetical protein